MRDTIVLQNLHKRGINLNDMDTLLRYEAPERKPRVLDSAPKRITLVKVKPSELVTLGCRAQLMNMYEFIIDELNGDTFTIDIKGYKRYCDKRVFAILQALIRLGYTKSESIAKACFEVFRTIVMCKCDTLTLTRVHEELYKYKTEDYYINELLAGTLACLFPNDDMRAECHWKSIVDFRGYYGAAVELGTEVIRKNCKTEKDVQKFLGEQYKLAKEDKEFMKNIYKPGANKWLIGMLYYLRESNPEILEPSKDSVGFA